MSKNDPKKNQKNNSKNKKRSLILSIMLMSAVIVVLTALAIGGNAVMSLRSMTGTANQIYDYAMNQGYNTEIKSQVQSTIAVMQAEYDKFQAGEKTEEQAKYDAKETIRIMRYRDDQSGYFWIDDTDYNLIMHPILVENEGTNRYDLKDPNGVMIIQEVVKVCQTPEKGGFNEFYFTKSDGVTVAPKIAYSQIFEPWGWIVSTGNYIDDIDQAREETSSYLKGIYQKVLMRVDIVFIISILIALIIAYVVAQRIINPLKRIQEFANRISKGDLTTDIDVKQNNEIGQTADALRTAQDNIRELLRGITDVANGVNNILSQFDSSFTNMRESISQVSVAVDSIANNVNLQAGSTDSANGDVSVMADKIKLTESEVESLNKNSMDMNNISEQSMETLKQLIQINDATRENISNMTEQINSTHKSVQQIHMAANLINEISDQTSLLALNASIEAARAGEAGKGFAVVAGEIAKLANQSTESVEEINKVVEELQSNATKSVEGMKEINVSVEKQVESLTETHKIFMEFQRELDNCESSVQSIDDLTVEVEKQRSNVIESLALLNDLAQDNAAVAQETSAMSTDLSKVVDDSNSIVEDLESTVTVLMDSIHKFKI
ncbi:MAG: methyl-accepting chemotaxis protein [Lachnospiraceae bacterium]|nr:methyl-accepting chemotaxis protein [Lachnospiraceae bacterium]